MDYMDRNIVDSNNHPYQIVAEMAWRIVVADRSSAAPRPGLNAKEAVAIAKEIYDESMRQCQWSA